MDKMKQRKMVELSIDVWREAKAKAVKEGRTLYTYVEEALRHYNERKTEGRDAQ